MYESIDEKKKTELNNTNNTSGGVEKRAVPAPYLQRSVSAPAIAEHVSEAIIPPLKFDVSAKLHLNTFPY